MKSHPKLNSAQKRAVLHKEGPLLVLAGAGAGKTRVIVERIAGLICSGIAPERILAVTFTNKAASEVRERVEKLVAEDWSLSPYDKPKTVPFIGTFHALSLLIIRAFHDRAGLPKRFTIYDRQDSLRAVKEAAIAAGFDPKAFPPQRLLAVIARQKESAVGRGEFRDAAASYVDEAAAEVWEKYDAILARERVLDFDDILLSAHALLTNHADVRDHFQNAWHYRHVDEYQDTNRVQYEIIKILAAPDGNLAVVGDVDQNIYSWRGASIAYLLNFERDFPHATVIPLVENYRSTKTIIAAANNAIEKNVRRPEKTLYTKNPQGERIAIASFLNENAEAAFVAHEAAGLIGRGADPNEIAVLYRANFQSRALEEAFLKARVPYQVLGTRFFERKEVKDVLSYLRLAMNPASAADLARASATPPRGIGKVTLAKIVNGEERSLSQEARGKVSAFRNVLSRIKKALEEKRASEAVRTVLTESGLWESLRKGSSDDIERLENLKELVTVAAKYDSFEPPQGIEKLLEEAALQSDQDELEKERGRDSVKLMTVHAAKGLEFDTVVVTGLEDGLFPHERDGLETVDEEEERRLFYVALTRAKQKVYLTYALVRRIFGTRSRNMPSGFIEEIDSSLVEIATILPRNRQKQEEDIIQ